MSVITNVCRFKITFVYLTLVIQNGNGVYEDREAFHLTMLSIANINVYLRLWINAVWIQSTGWIILTEHVQSTGEKPTFNVMLSAKNPVHTGPGWNHYLRERTQANSTLRKLHCCSCSCHVIMSVFLCSSSSLKQFSTPRKIPSLTVALTRHWTWPQPNERHLSYRLWSFNLKLRAHLALP